MFSKHIKTADEQIEPPMEIRKLCNLLEAKLYLLRYIVIFITEAGLFQLEVIHARNIQGALDAATQVLPQREIYSITRAA